IIMQYVNKKLSIDEVSIRIGTDKKIYASGYREIKMTDGTVADIATYWPGWQLCDGTNGTPDMRDRFVVGARQDDAGVAKTNVTGSLTKSGDGQLIQHLHAAGTLTGGAHTHPSGVGSNSASGGLSSNGSDWSSPINTGSGGAVAVTGSTANTGTGTKNVAVYYALCFIMKV
ncbi:MAG: hypothetical protein WC547_09710, partial [Candidatus Omnitrophota bacterium]